MPNYRVTLVRTITTVISVTAKTAIEARRQVYAYGPLEAVSDYPTLCEDVLVVVKHAKAAQ